jgi:hypothetical protein
MRAFLASHSNIAIPAVGSNMWTYFYNRFGDLKIPDNFERCLNAMLTYKHVRFLQPDPDRIRREFWEGRPTYARLFSLFLIHYADGMGKTRWGAQTGLIERYADHLFSAYPGLKVIHMVRDPRDRYEASLALWPNGKGRAGGAVTRWLYSMGLAERNLRLYPGRYKIVRFESLVTQTEKTLKEVSSFLGEAYEPAMLAMKSAPKLRSKLLKDRQINPDQNLLSPKYLGLFRQNISKREIAFIQLHAGRKMRTYGYPLDDIAFSPGEWFSFAAIEWPNQWARMMGWITIETLQQYLPGLIGRKPGKRMIIEAPIKIANKAEKG